MPEIIYKTTNVLLPFAFGLACIVVLYLLFNQKTLLIRILCTTFLIVIAIQALVGFGGDSILKAITGNKIISAFEGIVNPPNADPILVQRYLYTQQLFYLMGSWVTPICLIGISVSLFINQLFNGNKFKIIIAVILGIFAFSFFIEAAGNVVGVFGTGRLN
jgi:hypothetical protein